MQNYIDLLKDKNFIRRFLARFLDILLAMISFEVVAYAFSKIYFKTNENLISAIIDFLLSTINLYIGFIFLEVLFVTLFSASIGKLLMKIKIIDVSGGKITFLISLMRAWAIFWRCLAVIVTFIATLVTIKMVLEHTAPLSLTIFVSVILAICYMYIFKMINGILIALRSQDQTPIDKKFDTMVLYTPITKRDYILFAVCFVVCLFLVIDRGF